MNVNRVIPQLRTTDLDATIDFYVERLGFALEFRHADFYAGIRIGDGQVHLKRVDDTDSSIDFVRRGDHLHLYFDVDDVDAFASAMKAKAVRFGLDVHDTAWGTRECSVFDDQGHTLYFGAPRHR